MSTEEPVFDYPERNRIVAASLREWGFDALLVTTPGDLRYLTGFGGTTELGSNPFTGGPSAALLFTEELSLLCLPQSDVGEVSLGAAGLELVTYPTFLDLSPLYPRARLAATVADALERAGVSRGSLGYQGESLPVGVYLRLSERFPELRCQDLGGRIGLVRMRKSSDEIAALRRSVALCDLAQATVRETAQPGVREVDVLATVRQAIEAEVGRSLVLIHQITSGPRAGAIENATSERELREGDLLLTDIAPQLDGYWGDSCGSQVVGKPSKDQARMLRVIEEALTKGTESVRPGIPTNEVDQLMREHVGASYPSYPNAGGHGIGLDYHEPPRLVPREELELDSGMVLALEPGVYLPDVGGIRLEHVVLVTKDGCEVLSKHLDIGA